MSAGGFGWLYTSQTFDWKSRPLGTTNADGTTREAVYEGCGCAGGEKVTLIDEGTQVGVPPNNATKKRQQRIYSDVFGRPWKTEVLNWDGSGPNGTGTDSTVYSATVTKYNALDQVTKTLHYAGPVGINSVQESRIDYDGYGRVWKTYRPEQQVDTNNSASSDHSTILYNDDGTVASSTDARGVVTSFSYDARHQVTHVGYNAPTVNTPGSPITPTPNVDYAYDAAGNRLWMNEDSQRRVTYEYDLLSRLKWEDRQFPNLTGTYRLSYEYSFTGQVTKVTDETSDTSFTTGLDSLGRVSNVTAVGLGGATTTFASSVGYRASGAVKSISYGNQTELHVGYDERLELSSKVGDERMKQVAYS